MKKLILAFIFLIFCVAEIPAVPREAEKIILRLTVITIITGIMTRIMMVIGMVRAITMSDIILTATATILGAMTITADGLIFILMIMAIGGLRAGIINPCSREIQTASAVAA